MLDVEPFAAVLQGEEQLLRPLLRFGLLSISRYRKFQKNQGSSDSFEGSEDW
jgi:hypothetical protein